jgi:hypothetical protein
MPSFNRRLPRLTPTTLLLFSKVSLVTLLLSLLIVFPGCEKADYTNSDDVELNILPTIPVVDNLLSFRSIEEFAETAKVISLNSDGVVNEHMRESGFQSMWMDYSSIMDRLEADDLSTIEDILTIDELKRMNINDGSVLPRNSTRMFASLIDKGGYFIVDGNLNYLSDNEHAYVPGIDYEGLKKVILSQSTSEIPGANYTAQRISKGSESTDVASKWLANCTGFTARFTNLEETVQNNNRRLTLQYYTTILSQGPQNNLTFTFMLHGKIRNRKKKGFSWRRNWRRSQLRILSTGSGFLSSDLSVTEQTLFGFGERFAFIGPLNSSSSLTVVTSDGVTADGKVSDWDVVYGTVNQPNPLSFDTGNTDRFIPQNLLRLRRLEGKHLDNDNGSITVTNHGCQ